MSHNICCFAGHRNMYDEAEVSAKLTNKIFDLIQNYDVKEFLVGHYGKFDMLSAHCVRKAKEKYPIISNGIMIITTKSLLLIFRQTLQKDYT